MALRRQRVTIELDGFDKPVELELINPDFLRVEAELPKYGLTTSPKKAPMTYFTACAWAACKRLGLYDGDLMDFKTTDCLMLDVESEPDPVDPTAPGTDTG